MDIIDQMWFFQHFILNVFELHPFEVEMVYNTWNLTVILLAGGNQPCQPKGHFMAPQTPICLAFPFSKFTFHPGLGQPFPGGTTCSIHTRSFGVQSLTALLSEEMQLIDWIRRFLFFFFGCFLCFAAYWGMWMTNFLWPAFEGWSLSRAGVAIAQRWNVLGT